MMPGNGVQERSTTSIGLAERRKAESRQRLLQAARRLFTEHGYHATRPQDIARAAGVGHGTFYLHFADKQACFLAFANEASAELASFVRQRLTGAEDIDARVRGVLRGVLDYADRNPGVLKAAITDLSMITPEAAPGSTLADRWAADWAEEIRAGIAKGNVRDDYNPLVIGHAIVGLLSAGIRCGARTGVSRKALIDNLARFLVSALAPDRAAPADATAKPAKGRAKP